MGSFTASQTDVEKTFCRSGRALYTLRFTNWNRKAGLPLNGWSATPGGASSSTRWSEKGGSSWTRLRIGSVCPEPPIHWFGPKTVCGHPQL